MSETHSQLAARLTQCTAVAGESQVESQSAMHHMNSGKQGHTQNASFTPTLFCSLPDPAGQEKAEQEHFGMPGIMSWDRWLEPR